MATKSISQLDTQATANETDLFEVAIVDANSASGYASKKESAAAIADAMVGEYQYPLRITGTTAKTIAGAINELKNLVDLLPQFAIEVVQTLPVSDISETTIYLVPASDPEQGNYYEEYIYVNNTWELVGTTAVDLSGYYTSAQVDTLLAAKANTSSLATVATSGAYSDLSGKPTIDTELDDESTNAVQNKAIYSGIVDRIKGLRTPKDATITDGIAVIDDADMVEENPLKSLVVSVEGYQEGSGDPSPTNVRPLHGWTGANITRGGKNLFNIYDDKTIGAQSYQYDYYVKPNTAYTVSCNMPQTYPASLYFNGGNSSTNGVYKNHPLTFTSDANGLLTIYVRYEASSTSINLYEAVIDGTYWIQFEEGSTATEYEPYNPSSKTYPISWQTEAGEIYSGTLDVINGVLTKTYGIVTYDGTEDWFLQVASGINTFRVARPSDATRGVNVFANLYATARTENVRDGAFYIASSNIVIGDSTKADLNAFTSALATNHLQIAYLLATPTEYQLTPTQVTALIEKNNIFADCGAVTECKYKNMATWKDTQ